MSTGRIPSGDRSRALCLLLGAQIGGATVYFLQHRAEINHPLYLGIFTATSFAALATADRIVKQRTRLSNTGATSG
ncbi:hypothetical protein [Kitasatospora sp. NPDC057015]|uniref:hypothetical protein n=1 Tax=Kitasatospora sp. NPDC057015 TaxID=3346001 RepID=UPI00362F8ABD